MASHDHPTSTSGRRVLAAGAGLGGAALATTVATAGEAAATDTGAGWLNVKDVAYGALGDNSADDRPAVQKAIDAAGQGGTVYVPPGRYKLGAPPRLPLCVTLHGDWNPHFPDRTFMVGSFLRPMYPDTELSTGFDGAAPIVVDPAPDASSTTDAYPKSAHQGGPRLYGLALRGCQDDQNLTVLNKARQLLDGDGRLQHRPRRPGRLPPLDLGGRPLPPTPRLPGQTGRQGRPPAPPASSS
ncbi:glycosyl hydrolase family 28-related protein [Streptomyces sp. NPDC101776]|uniref:glycosyl hydrolase family 28-related protein n=1 Tax=Streptomyces sp. NPDC101776 TaxID=3366146 RepID=UPI0038284E7F